MARLSFFLLPGLLSVAVLTGCGNKGPLYLPAAPIEQVSTSEQLLDETSTPANQPEDENTTAANTAVNAAVNEDQNRVAADDSNATQTSAPQAQTREAPSDEEPLPGGAEIDSSGLSPDTAP